jgi:hypothetical protein
MHSDNQLLFRRTVLFGTPLLYIVLGIIHPMEDPGMGDATSVFIALHFAQLFLIAGIALSLWFLVDGLESRAAKVTRALILPYVILYTTLDAIAGLAMGEVVAAANALPAADQAAAGRLIDDLRQVEITGYVFYAAVGLAWLGVAFSAIVALRHRSPRPALVLMGLGALVFAVGHPKPFGPVGMGLFLAGVVWIELRPQTAEARSLGVQPTG